MADIFISYKREDQEEFGRVRPIAEALRAEGYDVFYDVQVPPGSSWEDVLQSKINAARAVLVLWSRHSVDSDWVKEEAEMAKHAGKLIPVFLDAVPPPFGFARIEGANLVDWDGDLTHIEWKNLVAAIKTRIGAGERDVQPELTRVAYQPSKTVTVTKAAPKKGRGGVFKALAAVIALALVGGIGLVGFTFLQQDQRTRASTETAAVAVEAAEEAVQEARPSSPSTSPATAETRPTATVNPTVREAISGRELTAQRPAEVQLSPAQREAISDVVVSAVPRPDESCREYGGDWQVRQEQGRYKLFGSGRRTVIEFPNREEAQRGLLILEKFGLEEYCTVGSEFRYFKTGGVLPSGELGGEDCVPVRQGQLGYKVAGGRHLVMSG
ncbi:MAG: toll/interleukin-1 receptor domain-containing protein, partial [Pseudomonadota bacterium]